MNNPASIIDHTLLRSDLPLGEYTQAVRDCNQYKFKSICVNSGLVSLVHNLLHDNLNNISIASTVGFPLGSSSMDAKLLEINKGIKLGVSEFDVVPLISAVKSGDWNHYEKEIKQFRIVTQEHVLKIILEVGLLTDDEVKKCVEICLSYNVDFVKTSTGFAKELKPIETVRYVKIMADMVKGTKTQVKASGWIRTVADFNLMLENGATRIGCSRSVDLMKEFDNGR